MSTTANLIKEFQTITSDGRIVIREFAKPLFQNVFFRNKDYLANNSDIIDFDQTVWKYNPQKFCLDHYEIPHIYPVILLTNDLKSMFEFTGEYMNSKIIAPKIYSLINILTFPRV